LLFYIFLLCDVAVTAAVGHSRGRGLLKFSSGSPSPAGLNTRPPGQVHWVSEQWSPPVMTCSSSAMNLMSLTSTVAETASQGDRRFSVSPPVPSHSTPTLSLHSKDMPAQHASGGAMAVSDLSPSPVSPRSASKRAETHATAVNGNIPLMTSASDPLPVQAHTSRVDPVFRSPSPSLCLAKTVRASPHHINIQTSQPSFSSPSPSPHMLSTSPVLLTSPVALGSWPSLVDSATVSPHTATVAANSSGVQSVLCPLAPMFVPQHYSADSNVVSVRL